MKSPSLIFCEFEASGLDQSEVNAAFLATAREAFPDSHIHFFAEKNHLSLVRDRLSEHCISEVRFHLISLLHTPGEKSRTTSEFFFFTKLLFYAQYLRAQRVVLCTLRKRRVKWANLLALIGRRFQVVAIMHHTLDCLKQRKKATLFDQVVFPRKPPKNLVYLVLGSSIAQHTATAFPNLARSIRWMHHPYFYPSREPSKSLNGAAIVFGFYGVAKKNKGAHHFRDLAMMLKRSQTGLSARFLFLGFHWKNAEQMHLIQEIEVPESALPQNGGELRRSEIQELSREVHYAMFPYDQKEYTYRSSGTLFDAIAYGSPIIALDNPLFRAYFEEFGDIGYLCSTVEEIQRTVMDILKVAPSERYEQQQACLAQARRKLRISNLAPDFKNLRH